MIDQLSRSPRGQAKVRIEKQRWWAAILMHLGRPKEPEQGRVELQVDVVRGGLQDPNNVDKSLKILVDQLVKLGWIRDDREKWLEYRRPTETKSADPEKRGTRIRIRRI